MDALGDPRTGRGGGVAAGVLSVQALTHGTDIERLLQVVYEYERLFRELFGREAHLTVSAAALQADVPVRTIYHWVRTGKVRYSRPQGRGHGIAVDAESLRVQAERYHGNTARLTPQPHSAV